MRPRRVISHPPRFSMTDENDLPELTATTTLLYKARNGEVKELQVVQPMDPTKRRFDFRDLQILAQEISKVLREDG